MLVTNITTYVLIIVLLTVVPMLPAMVMSRFLSTGLANDRTERAAPAERAAMSEHATMSERTVVAAGRK